MARMSVDDSIARDPRITHLSQILRWTRNETVGVLVAKVWPVCYDQRTHLVTEYLIDIAADTVGFAKAMIECELARRDRSGKVVIGGAKERIAYLDHKARAGKQGGIKSAERRANGIKQAAPVAQALGNPPDPVPSPAPVPVSAPVPDPDLRSPYSPPKGGRSRSRKPTALTPEESASVRVVLDKLGKQNGISYTGSGEHARLIASRLRDGTSEMDLRRVVAYCAEFLEWKTKPEMLPYLRPETLFGPKTIAKYLDAARAWFAQAERSNAQ